MSGHSILLDLLISGSRYEQQLGEQVLVEPVKFMSDVP